MDGVIVLNKPWGKTSHDMVSLIRRLYGTRRVGHTGTLDPAATGVLPICIGKATKAAELLTAADKAYRAQLVLGMITDTQDAEGEILAEQPVFCTEAEIQKAVQEFVGTIQQIPPMYSAIKKDGKKLYELARAGIAVEREPRQVTISRIDVEEIDLSKGTVNLHVECTKGTYIRTLCEDIGLRLGCGAYMNKLERTKSGRFSLTDSLTCDELAAMDAAGRQAALIPVDQLFLNFPEIRLNGGQTEKVRNGARIPYPDLETGAQYRIYGSGGEFLAVSRYDGERLCLEKAFWN